MNWNVLFFVCLVIATVLLLVIGIDRIWQNYWSKNTSDIQRRLRVISGDMTAENRLQVKTRLLSEVEFINDALAKIPYTDKLDVFITQAGLQFSVGVFLARLLVLTLLSLLLLVYLQGNSIGVVLLSLLPSLLWLLYLQHKRGLRVSQIEAQLPDTLDLMARAMQAGHAFSSALLIVGSEGPPPIRHEFQTTFDEINFGISTDIALHHLTHRVASSDLRFFVVAVLIQLEPGGNLTEILKSLAALIRDRQRIAGTVRVLTAEGRLSAWILGLLPFGLAGILSVVNPDFISKLWTDPLGIRMLQVSLSLMAIGVWWMWRMVRVEI